MFSLTANDEEGREGTDAFERHDSGVAYLKLERRRREGARY
jgi:hypothetical protein